MAKQHSSVRMAPNVRAEELKAIVGDIDDARVMEILALHPTVAELEQAAMWVAGSGDNLAEAGRPLSGIVADIVDILLPAEDEEPPVRR
jgi:hypothetical protein